MTNTTPPELLTRREAADILRVSTTTLSRHIGAGTIYAVRLGRQLRIPRAAVDAFLAGTRYEHDVPDPIGRPDLGTWPPTPSLFTGE